MTKHADPKEFERLLADLRACRLCAAHLPLPHPSWRNNSWLKKNPWFEAEALPELRRRVRRLTGKGK